MDVTLYVWRLSPTNVGHASLQIGDTYMSYWPAEGAGKKDVKIGQSPDEVLRYAKEIRSRKPRP